jgi:hypothetical protein
MSGSPAASEFVEKWFRREPEMRVAAAFCARADRPLGDRAAAELRFTAWGALLHELREALFEISDPGVAAAKRGWWAEELQAIAGARPRHPLGLALLDSPECVAAPWTGLALAMIGSGGEPRQPDAAQALAALQPLAAATIAVENALFQPRDAGDAPARALAVHWLLQRLPHGLGHEDGARVPMHLLARHGLTLAQLPAASDALLRDWAAELAQALPAASGGAFLRRARARFDAARLEALRRGGQGGFAEPAPLATLWRAWRAARGA